MTLPSWNTHAAFMTDHTRHFGEIGDLRIEGHYIYYSQVDPRHVETLSLTVDVSEVTHGRLVFLLNLQQIGKCSQFQSTRLGHTPSD